MLSKFEVLEVKESQAVCKSVSATSQIHCFISEH